MATASNLTLVSTAETSALAVVETMSAAMLFEPGIIDPILERIRAEVLSVKGDISTEKGRKAIASLAYKVARTKTFIDDQRLALVTGEKKRLALIDAEGKRIREDLEALKDEVRKPLTEWETAEKDRVKAHEDALTEMTNYALDRSMRSVADVEAQIQRIGAIYSGRAWQEFSQRAVEVRDNVLVVLDGALGDARRREAEAAELARLRREATEREQRDREERIAREAKEKAEREARLREEANARAIEQERLRSEREAREREESIRREKEAAESRARKAEADRIQAEEDARVREKLAAEKAERDRIAAAEKAERERLAAIEAERQRIERERKAEEDAAAQRKADREHRRDVNKAAVAAFVAAGIKIDHAILAVEAIVKGSVPNITITY